MGTGIAIVANRVGGYKVKVVDTTEKALSNSRKFSEDWCEKEIAKKRLTSEQRYEILSRFSYSTDLKELSEADFIIEVMISFNI